MSNKEFRSKSQIPIKNTGSQENKCNESITNSESRILN